MARYTELRVETVQDRIKYLNKEIIEQLPPEQIYNMFLDCHIIINRLSKGC
jgi:hypothetical protein